MCCDNNKNIRQKAVALIRRLREVNEKEVYNESREDTDTDGDNDDTNIPVDEYLIEYTDDDTDSEEVEENFEVELDRNVRKVIVPKLQW